MDSPFTSWDFEHGNRESHIYHTAMHESDSDGRDTGGAGLCPEPGISGGDLLRTVIDLVPALSYAKGLHGRFIVCNRFTARSMGATPRSEEHTSEMQSRVPLVRRLRV